MKGQISHKLKHKFMRETENENIDAKRFAKKKLS